MKEFKTLLLVLMLVFSTASYSETISENASIAVGYDDITLAKVRFPRMPRKYSVESLETSTGLVDVSFDNNFSNVYIYIYKEGNELLSDNYPVINSDTMLTYDLNTWGRGTYIVEISTDDGVGISKQVEFD